MTNQNLTPQSIPNWFLDVAKVARTSKHQEVMVDNNNKTNLQSRNQLSGHLQQDDSGFRCHIRVKKRFLPSHFQVNRKSVDLRVKLVPIRPNTALNTVHHSLKKTTTKQCLPAVNTRVHMKFFVSDIQGYLNIQCF